MSNQPAAAATPHRSAALMRGGFFASAETQFCPERLLPPLSESRIDQGRLKFNRAELYPPILQSFSFQDRLFLYLSHDISFTSQKVEFPLAGTRFAGS